MSTSNQGQATAAASQNPAAGKPSTGAEPSKQSGNPPQRPAGRKKLEEEKKQAELAE